jgi:two-component system, LuxR family, sensor kinase FixL
MGWVTILYVAMAAFSATIAGIYLGAWLMQREATSYLLFALLAVSIAFLAATELWMLRARTPEEYATALRWFQVPAWSGFLAIVGLVGLRLRPRFSWVGWLAAGLRTVSLIANFVSGPNLNYAALTAIDHLTLFGEPVAIAASGVPNPWMLTGQAALVLSILFVLDGGISTWRRGEGLRSLVLTISLLLGVVGATAQAVLVFWGFVQLPILIAPVFLFVAAVMGAELSFGLPRAARAEHDVRIKGAALAVSEERLSLAAEAADAGFWSLDEHSGEVWATGKTRELFGLTPGGDLRLADFLNRVHPRDRVRLQTLIEAALRSHERFRTEFRVVDRDGGVRWLAGSGRCVGNTETGSKTLMGVSVDITARRAALDKLRRQRARLERASKEETVSELSAALAHELNQPLAMILTNAEAAQALLAQARPNLAEVGEILADIVTADRRAADVIRHLRGLLDRGEPQRQALLLDDAIHRVLALVGNEIDDQGVTVDLSLASELPPVKADRILIEQTLLNLINNACEAVSGNPPGARRVSVVTRPHPGGVAVEVADNGTGVSEPERAFDPFYSTKPGGLGMGLAIVRSVVSAHGGRVWAQSAPARGATIIFTLPAEGPAP